MNIDLYWEPFSISGYVVRKHGDLRGERKIGETMHADFLAQFTLYFGLFCCL